ncbi:MAG: tyrosine-type recombinase/integrase [Parvibaculum sp.]
MPRTINRLSARTAATAALPGLLSDGGGLYLQVRKDGNRSWVFRFTRDGRTRDMGLGALHTVSLSEARTAATECRKQLQADIDPIDHRRALKAAKRLEASKAMTFDQCATAYIAAHRDGWKNAKHASQWQNTLEQYASPIIGKLPVANIDTGHILKTLEPIWKDKSETASRLRGRVENILDWATVRGYRQGENPARWRGHLDKTLPKRSKVQTVAHHSALPYEQVGAFMALLRERSDLSARALEMLILTATRTGEMIGAKWSEFDFEAASWTIPAERMKAKKEHRVPLSKPAIALLENLPRIHGSDFLFPGARSDRHMSNMACLTLLRRMGRNDITVHGFRSTFRDWAAEQTAYPREVAERALAHTLKDKAEAAYQRRDLFDKRQKLMEAWARFCSTQTKRDAKIVAIRNAQ